MSEERPVKALVDARGLACPMPLVKLRQALMVLEPGDRVRLLATDPQARSDVDEFCFAGGHDLVDVQEEAHILSFVVAKAST